MCIGGLISIRSEVTSHNKMAQSPLYTLQHEKGGVTDNGGGDSVRTGTNEVIMELVPSQIRLQLASHLLSWADKVGLPGAVSRSSRMIYRPREKGW